MDINKNQATLLPARFAFSLHTCVGGGVCGCVKPGGHNWRAMPQAVCTSDAYLEKQTYSEVRRFLSRDGCFQGARILEIIIKTLKIMNLQDA